MSGQRGHVVGSKRPREEVFLTSTSLSFSSLSSFCASSDDDDAIEISMTKTSDEDQIGKALKASFPGSEISCVPVRLMDECLGTHYDPERIPASVFAKSGGDANWTNDSLFSLRMSTCQGINIEPEYGEFLAYSPSLLVKTEEAEEEKRSQVIKETKSAVTTKTHQEKSSSSATAAVSWSCTNYPTSFYQLYQAPKAQSCPLPVGERKSKKSKIKKRKEEKKTKKEKKIIWSWFSSGILKCNLRCCSRNRELKAMVM